MIIGDALFRNNDLDNYLRAQVGAVDEHVRKTVSKTDLGKTDSEIAQQHLPSARVEPLQVDFENPQKDVSEARVRVHDVFDGGARSTEYARPAASHLRAIQLSFRSRPIPIRVCCPMVSSEATASSLARKAATTRRR